MGTLSSNYPNSRAVEAALNRANKAEHDVALLSVDVDDLSERVAALEYKEVKINSFSASPKTCELGSSNSIVLTWTLSKSANLTLNGTAVTGNTYTATNVMSSQTYTLTATDGQTTDSKSIDVTFANQIYYGAAANASAITELSKVLSNTVARTITVDAGEGQYIYYAYPARLGDVAFYVGGFEGGFELASTESLINTQGYSEIYRIYRSVNANLGNTTVEIKEG